MLPFSRSSRLGRMLGAGVVAGTLIAAVPSPAPAAPRPVMALAAAEASYDQKLAVGVKFGLGDEASALAELADRDFVIELWERIQADPDRLESRVAAEAAFTADPASDACYTFIVTGVYAAFDRDVARELDEAERKRASDVARSTAAASIDVVADAQLLTGSDADFVRRVLDRVTTDGRWPKVKAAATAALAGSDADRAQFIATGMAAAAKQDVDDRIAADQQKTEEQKAAERARAARKLALNRIGLAATDERLDLTDRDFVVEIWNNTPDGSEVQAAAIAASRSLDPAVWKAFIDTGIHAARDRDIEIALEKEYQADKAVATKIKADATAAGDVNLAYWAGRALAGTPTELDTFVRAGQFDLDVRTGFESADVRPTGVAPVANGVVNVAGQAIGVATIDYAHGGTAALAYAGTDRNTQSSYAYLKMLNVSRVTVKPKTTLSYWIMPHSADAEIGSRTRNATCVAVDLVFSDGSRLKDTQLKDQRGTRINPQAQCSKLIADEWNQVVVPLGSLADRQVTSIVIGYDQPANGGAYRGKIDDVTITDQPVEITDPGHPRQNYPVDNYRNDFTGDGFTDIFTRNTAGDLRLHRGDGRNWWIEPSVTVKIGAGWNQFDFVFAAPDLNGDKNVDVIAHNSAGELYLYPGNGRGGWAASTPTKLSLKLTGITSIFSPGDFDGDGKTDIIVRNSAAAAQLYRGNGAGGFSSPATIAPNWRPYGPIFSPGDFDSDGFSDIILKDARGLWLQRGDGEGGLLGSLTRIGASQDWGAYTAISSPGDFTGDGVADIVFRRADGVLALMAGNGRGDVYQGSIDKYEIGSGWNIFNLIF